MRAMLLLLARLAATLLCLGGVCPARILMMTLGGTRSHKVPFLALGQGLISKGHQVTLVSAFPPMYHSSVEEISPKKLQEAVQSFATMDMLGPKLRGERSFSILDIINYAHTVCDVFYSAQETQLLMSSRPDMVVLDGAYPECLLGLVHHFSVPFIYVNTVAFYTVALSLAGNPTLYSFTPFFDSSHSDDMTFLERSLNGILHIITHGVVTVINKFYIEPIIRRHIGLDVPSNDVMGRNVSLILQNGHFTVTYPRPFLPNVVEVACIHCTEPQSLPKDLEEFVTGGRAKGFVYVSFGTSVQSSQFPEELRLLMVKVFSALPYQVLWKYEDTIPDLPENVRLARWLPQQDLLGHPMIVAFVNHGGLHSVIEAVYHAVPMVTIPVFCDHSANSRKAEDDGYAIVLDLHTMTGDSLLAAVNKLIADKRYKENADHRSLLLRDQPELPLDKALYWVQYVLRHRGAPHLQSAAKNLTLTQYFMLDTLGALVLAAYLILNLFKIAWHKVFRRCKSRKIKDE